MYQGHPDPQTHVRGACPEDERLQHFTESAQQFYKISTTTDRDKFIAFAMQVVMADKKMEQAENAYINALYDTWGLD